MTCGEVSEHLDRANSRGWGDLPAQVREHLDQCQCCKGLWDFLTSPDTAELAPELRSRINRSVQQSLEPVKPLPSTRLLTLGFLLIFGLISAGFVGISGLRGADAMGNMEFAGMLGVIGAAAFLVAFTLSREMAPGEKRVLTAPRLFLLLLAPLFLAASLLFPWDFSRNVLPLSWRCFRNGFMFSLPAAGLVVMLLRRGAVLSLGVVGAGAGLLAGLVGVVVLHFGCGMNNAAHVALAHLGIPLAGAVIGAAIGRLLHRVRPWRAAAGQNS